MPAYFVGATPFNLLVDRWVRRITYISYYDAWYGGHPRVFTPEDKPYVLSIRAGRLSTLLLRRWERSRGRTTSTRRSGSSGG